MNRMNILLFGVLLGLAVLVLKQRKPVYIWLFVILVFITLFWKTKESFQTVSCTDITYRVNLGSGLTARIDDINKVFSNKAVNVTVGNSVYFTELSNLFPSSTASNASYIPPSGPGLPATNTGVIKYLFLSELANTLYKNSCYTQLLTMLIWMMSSQNFLFTPQYKYSVFTRNLAVVDNENYLNFAYAYQDNLSIPNAVQTVRANTSPVGLIPNGSSLQISILVRDLCILYILLRPRLNIDRNSTTQPEKLQMYYIGQWLSRLIRILWARYEPAVSFGGRLMIQRINSMFWDFVGNPFPSGTFTYIPRMDVHWNAIRFVTQLTGLRSTTNPNISHPVSTSNFGYEFRIPGFIWSAATPTADVIDRHTVFLAHIFFGLLVLRKCPSTWWWIQGYVENILFSSSQNIKIQQFVADVYPATYIGPKYSMRDKLTAIVKNVAADEYIERAALAKGWDYTQLDIFLRNMLGDSTLCLDPLTTDKLLDQINQNPRNYSMTTLSPTAVGPLGYSMAEVTNTMRKALFKLQLDENNNTWFRSNNANRVTGTRIPVSMDSLTTSIPRLSHIDMLEYLFTSPMDDTKAPAVYFEKITMGIDLTNTLDANFNGYPMLTVSTREFIRALETNRVNFTNYSNAINPQKHPDRTVVAVAPKVLY